MNSAKIQQLLKIDPIRPPKSDNHRRSRSTLSTKTLSQTCSLQSQQQDTGCYPISTSSSIKFLQCNLIQIQTTEDCDPGEDERVSVTLPKSHLNSSIQENKNIYSYTKNLVNQVLSPKTFNKKKTPVIPKRVTKERRPLMDSISNISTPAVKYCDRTITFGLKVQDRSNASTESFDKENITSTKPLNAKDKKSKEQIKVKTLKKIYLMLIAS